MTEREYKQAYYQANKEQISEKHKRWYAEHRDEQIAYSRKYYREHKEEIAAKAKAKNAQKKAELHGTWLDFSHMANDMDTAACSVCHRYAYELTGHNEKMTLEYCPHCGAKLEGGNANRSD